MMLSVALGDKLLIICDRQLAERLRLVLRRSLQTLLIAL